MHYIVMDLEWNNTYAKRIKGFINEVIEEQTLRYAGNANTALSMIIVGNILAEVKASEITDIKQYNKENSIMWKVYALWYYLAAFMGFYYPIFAFILMIFSCTLGLVLLIMNYKRIEKKYKRK